MSNILRLAALSGLLSTSSVFAALQSSSMTSAGGGNVPEPGSLPLVVLGVVGALVVARFIKRK